jgi:hypothetical protein
MQLSYDIKAARIKNDTESKAKFFNIQGRVKSIRAEKIKTVGKRADERAAAKQRFGHIGRKLRDHGAECEDHDHRKEASFPAYR